MIFIRLINLVNKIMDKLQRLIKDVEFYNKLPTEMKDIFIENYKDTYADYNRILNIFPKLNENVITERYCTIKNKILNGENIEKFISDSKNYRGFFKYLKECVMESQNNQQKNFDDEQLDEIINDDTEDIIKLRDHQQKGVDSAINNNFNSGLHSLATGSGKSIMALKIMYEYYKKYPSNSQLWICERPDIMQKLFFKKQRDDKNKIKNYVMKKTENGVKYKYVKNEDVFKKLKNSDIIDMDKFEIIEFVYNKPSNWTTLINNYSGDKPLFIIANRAFLTTKSKMQNKKYKYQELIKNMPRFVMLDECHSSMAPMTFKFLTYAKFQYKAYIQGLSATPYRKGGSYVNVDTVTDDDNNEIKLKDNKDKLLKIFHKKGNTTELNILSWFNLKEAIEDGIILEPVFHWYNVKAYVGKTKNERQEQLNYDKQEQIIVMKMLNNIIEQFAHKKCIIWCRFKDQAETWKKFYDKEKDKYNNLQNIAAYIDHSGLSKNNMNDYDEFYEKEDNCILFCANKHREGSDIPNLSMCMFLDKVKKRGEIPFIQSVGRVLRHDVDGNKQNGHIIDCVENGENNTEKTKNVINKILGYYLQLYETTKSDFTLKIDNMDNNNKINEYNKIMNSITFDEKNNKIFIKFKNDKKATLDLMNMEYSVTEWNDIISGFDKLLKDVIISDEHSEFLKFQELCVSNKIKSKYDFFKRRKKCGLYYVDSKDNKEFVNPQEKWKSNFKNWYAFLKIQTEMFIKNKDDFVIYCHKHNITSDNYHEKVSEHKCLPEMPDEFYLDFTNLETELKSNNTIKRRCNNKNLIKQYDNHDVNSSNDSADEKIIIKPKKTRKKEKTCDI